MKHTKKLMVMICGLTAALILAGCGKKETAADAGKTETAQSTAETVTEETAETPVPEEEVQEEEEPAETFEPEKEAMEKTEGETGTEDVAYESPLDEIAGYYEMRPVEIFGITAEVTESDGYTFMYVHTSSGEYDYYLLDGNAYSYDPDLNKRSSDPVYTYEFENGVLTMTTMDQTSKNIFKKPNAE